MLIYVMLYLAALGFGVVVPIFSVNNSVIDSVAASAATITALFASLLVPFAAFAESEKWNKKVLLYAPVILLGFYMGTFLHNHNYVVCVELALATSIHAAYWLSSIHSRAYRLEQFKLGFTKDLPDIAKTIAILDGIGSSDLADDIVQKILTAGSKDLQGKLAGESVKEEVCRMLRERRKH